VHDVGDGLALRRATATDGDQLVAFNRSVQGEQAAAQVAYLVEGRQPGTRVEDFLVIADHEGRIVSSLCLTEVRLRLGQTVLTVGQPECVGTLPEYRRRGLVRRQFDVVHRWMRERDLAIGLIGGLPYYYRLFGYEYAIDITPLGTLEAAGLAGRVVMPPEVRVRRIVDDDIPALMRLADERNAQVDLGVDMDAAAWAWSTRAQRLEETGAEDWIALRAGKAIGSARVSGGGDHTLFIDRLAGDETAAAALVAAALALPGVTMLRMGSACAPRIGLWVAALRPQPLPLYALQIRVNDPARAVRQLAPALERRLAASAFAGLSRDLDLGLYRYGLRLTINSGTITDVTRQAGLGEPRIGIPPDVLPKLLFGYRDLDDLMDIYPDLYAREDRDLLRTLFPRLRPALHYFL